MIGRLLADPIIEPRFMEWLRMIDEDDRVAVDRPRGGCSLTVTAQHFSGCPMSDPRESDFWQAAIRSGLMDVESLTACWEAVEPAKRDQPEHISRRLARRAVQAKLLTFWQAQQLLAGHTGGYKVDRYVLLDLIGRGGDGASVCWQGTPGSTALWRLQDPLARAAG